MLRRAAVAGSWYPGDAVRLTALVDRLLDQGAERAMTSGEIVAVLAPHAGIIYSGSVAGVAYGALKQRSYDRIVLVGPSHYVGFEGVAAWPRGVFETPIGALAVDETAVSTLCDAGGPAVHAYVAAHAREHSLELQLPFVRRLFPQTPIVPLVMGDQTRETVDVLARVLGETLAGGRTLLIASSDLSHFFDRDRARVLDAQVAGLVDRFDADGLMALLEQYPEHERGRFVMCGGGPAVAVMKAARALGATSGRVLAQANSGDVSGDFDRVVGYMAAAFAREPSGAIRAG